MAMLGCAVEQAARRRTVDDDALMEATSLSSWGARQYLRNGPLGSGAACEEPLGVYRIM